MPPCKPGTTDQPEVSAYSRSISEATGCDPPCTGLLLYKPERILNVLGRMQEPSLGRGGFSLLQEDSNIVSAAQKLPLYRGKLNEGSPF